ncbi:hypothetical protein INT47_005669 [Mucor saturninus]|uniref:F-box domain-containing protein n=1 Tax=Mucor saturninus TaxID=64648 RepID=A0A8H7QTM1_9FUNG|nr:hypothetical protein INT47_005669 [Mucor saturninus]
MEGYFGFQTMTSTPRTFPEMDLVDVQNNKINVPLLASTHRLILITLKCASCATCPQLLKILNVYGLEPDINHYTDPYTLAELNMDSDRKQFFRLLLKYDAYFIIVCPGTDEEVAEIQRSTPFMDYPFIAGEGAMQLAKALKVQMSDTLLMPAILEVRKETLSVEAIHIGREPGRYFHQHLLGRLMEERYKLESSAIICVKDTYKVMNQIKRKRMKCQQGNMVALSLALPTASVSAKEPEVIKDRKQIQDLPLEILETIFSYYSHDIPSLIKSARTCRLFYITACNVSILCLKNQMIYLKQALPQTHDGEVICHEAEVRDQSLDRWSNRQPISFRELENRLENAKQKLLLLAHWTTSTRLSNGY